MNLLHELYNSITGPLKLMLDAFFIGTAWAAFVSMIPAMTAVLSLVWIGMRMYETYLSIREKKKNLKE